jgi:hypothetical protein
MVKVHYKVKMGFANVGCECVEWIHRMQDIAVGQALTYNEIYASIMAAEILRTFQGKSCTM